MNEMNRLTDEMLVDLYIKGNDTAFDILLNRHQSKIFQYIYHSVHNNELAEDFFQDVFIKIVMNLRSGKYTETGKFVPWVMRIAHNLILDYKRKSITEPDTISNENENGSDIFNDKSLAINENREQELIDEQTLSDAEYLVTLLPKTQREVIQMRFYEGLSFKEIAQKTGVSLNTALGRMHYAVHNLRRLAAEYGMTA